MIKNIVTDGTGTNYKAQVDNQHAILVSTVPYPPILTENKVSIYRAYLATSAGSTDMKVNGSVTPVEFFVQATTGADRFITQLSFELTDASMTLNRFGYLLALTNGCTLSYQKTGKTIIIHNAIKTNWDLVRLCFGNPAFGATVNTFIASNVFGVSEGIIPILDFTKILPPYGLKLDMDSVQKLIFTIRDNVTGVDSFNAIAYGFDREE